MSLFAAKLHQAVGSRYVLLTAPNEAVAAVFIEQACEFDSMEIVDPEHLLDNEFGGIAEVCTLWRISHE